MLESADLSGHVALVTGGRRGIGRAIARRLGACGARVVISGEKRSDEGVEETLTSFGQAGIPVAFVTCDLADEGSRSELVRRASEPFGPVDILVNNAAVGGHGTAPSDIPLARRRAIFEVNLQAPIDLTQQALPAMRGRGYGRILNLLSETMREPPIPHASPPEVVRSLVVYGASKIALERYGFGLAAELFGTGVHVNGLYPHRVCVTEQNSPRALEALRRDPSQAESLEVMAEAAFLLVAGSYTGLSVTSRQLLQSADQPVRSLDGKTVIGDARSLPDLG